MLSKADMNIITGESLPLYNYGVSMNKLFDYFASGKPTISTFKSKYSLIEKYGAGYETDQLDYEVIANNIENIASDETLYKRMCHGAMQAASEHDFSVLAKKLQDCIEGK